MKFKHIAYTTVACTLLQSAQSSLIMTLQNNPKSSSSKIPSAAINSSTKQDLIEKSQSIDSALSKTKIAGSYSSISWSNRLGTVLTPASIPGVYTADRPFIWNNIDVGGRMTVIALQTSSSTDNEKPDLFIHSPVFLDDQLISALDEIGTVKHVVSPNYEHVKYAQQWGEYYKDAKIWGCPGIMEKEPHVRWSEEIPVACRPPGYKFSKESTQAIDGMWDWNEIQPIHIDCERLPILGTPFFSEVLFYHAPSKSLLFTDAYWNYPRLDGITNADLADSVSLDEMNKRDFGVWELAPDVGRIPVGSRLWKFGMDKIYRPVYLGLLVEKEPFRDLTSFICNNLDVQTLIPCHGDLVRGQNLIRKVLRQHFALD